MLQKLTAKYDGCEAEQEVQLRQLLGVCPQLEQRGWLTQQGDKLMQQEAWLIHAILLDQQPTALVQQYSMDDTY